MHARLLAIPCTPCSHARSLACHNTPCPARARRHNNAGSPADAALFPPASPSSLQEYSAHALFNGRYPSKAVRELAGDAGFMARLLASLPGASPTAPCVSAVVAGLQGKSVLAGPLGPVGAAAPALPQPAPPPPHHATKASGVAGLLPQDTQPEPTAKQPPAAAQQQALPPPAPPGVLTAG